MGSKITEDGNCSHEIKRHLLLGKKVMVMTNLDSILKSRDITLPTKVCLVKAMVFPVVMYGCESWTVKKAEHWSNDAPGVGEGLAGLACCDSWGHKGLDTTEELNWTDVLFVPAFWRIFIPNGNWILQKPFYTFIGRIIWFFSEFC